MEAVCKIPEVVIPPSIPTTTNETSTVDTFADWPELINPRLLHQLSGLSMVLLVFIGLLAFGVAIGFAYACARLVIRGNKANADLDKNQSGGTFLERCDYFWMRAVIVPEPPKREKPRKKEKKTCLRIARRVKHVGYVADSHPLTPKSVIYL